MSLGRLTATNLGKAFRKYNSELSRILSLFGIPLDPIEEHWALKNVSFSIPPGQSVGIVGRNGAGKSTLLKLLTGTLRPTEGAISYSGRITAILELGMGFNHEFTGRQNVYHSAGLMGFDISDIDSTISTIESFAEIGDYFDQPMRTYSSGMQMRVAFSVATAFRPDIMIVDEALSVGDTYFQHKSFARIRELQNQGATILLVSHDKSAIQNLCNRAILLEKGRVIKDASPEEVMDYYNALIAEKENQRIEVRSHESGKVQTISGSGEATLQKIGLFDISGNPVEFVNVGQNVELRIDVKAHKFNPQLVLGYMIKDRLGEPVFGTNTYHTKQILKDLCAGELVRFRIRFSMNIGPGSYSITTALTSNDTHHENNYEWMDLALLFTITNHDKEIFTGVAWIPPVIEIDRQ
ncbi:MAG: ABC transporter ATP-binding protein [Leptospirales bacterium]